MIGFPDFILDSKELDDVYDGVSQQIAFVSIFSITQLCSSLNDIQRDWKKPKWFKYFK